MLNASDIPSRMLLVIERATYYTIASKKNKWTLVATSGDYVY